VLRSGAFSFWLCREPLPGRVAATATQTVQRTGGFEPRRGALRIVIRATTHLAIRHSCWPLRSYRNFFRAASFAS
jgi:hypothetical protein